MDRLAQAVAAQLDAANELYHRLVLVVGPAASGKTAALRSLCEHAGLPYANLNLALSQRLLEYPSKTRPLRLRGELDRLLASMQGDAIVLDNIEILFDPRLQQDPLRLLQLASRNRTIVASWNGESAGKTLTYAAAGHPEHRRYSDVDVVIVRAKAGDERPAEGTGV